MVRKFSKNSLLLLRYYFWIFPYLFFYLFFSILEAYAWSLKKTVLSNFLKEAGFRLSTTLLVLLFVLGALDFDLFIKLFSLLYAVCFFSLLFYLMSIKKFHLTITLSRVTRKFWKKMATLAGFIYGGMIITTAAQTVDSFSIMSFVPKGLAMLGVFDFSQYICSIISVPQRVWYPSAFPISKPGRIGFRYHTKNLFAQQSQPADGIALYFLLIWLNYDRAISAPLKRYLSLWQMGSICVGDQIHY